MQIEIRLPSAFKNYTSGALAVLAEGDTVAEVIDYLGTTYEGLNLELVDERGEQLARINIYRNEDDIRYLEGLNTTVREGDIITIIPSVAGG